MKTRPSLLLLFSVFSLFSLAQKGQPAFGMVDMADMLMTDCDFDKGADAVVLIDWGNTYYDRGTAGYSLFKTIFERRTRIKILKEKGIAETNIEIPFYTHNNEERILRLTANTYNIDGSGKIQTTEVKKSSIYTKRIDDYYSKMIIAFPDVKVGSIIEYSYTIDRETMGNLKNWYFSGRIPVRYSEYQLKIPQIFLFTVLPAVVDHIETKQDVIDELITVNEGVIETKSLKSNYVMRNLQGIRNEPYMGAAKDYMQRLEFNLTQIVYNKDHVEDISLKWKDVIDKLKKDADFGLQLQSQVPAAAALVEAALTINDREARMKFIYDKVRKNLRWNEDEDIYADVGIAKAWETGTGNSADLNLTLLKLLMDAGLPAKPILFSTRNHGLVMPNYTFLNQFNTVMAYVVVNDKIFVLDATNKYSNYKLVPERVVNTRGFIVEGENGSWKDILSGKNKYKIMAAAQGEIDASGTMHGTCLVNAYDYARTVRCYEWMTDKEKFKNDHFFSLYPNLKISEITIANADADSLPLEQKIKFSSVLSSSGNYRYFSVNLFSDLETNPFISDKRVSDIDFGVQQDYTIFGNFTIPPDYSFDGLPENISLTTSDNSIVFNRYIQADENLLNVRMTIEFKRSFYPADYYDEFKEFYKKLFDKLDEQVVIKKKANP